MVIFAFRAMAPLKLFAARRQIQFPSISQWPAGSRTVFVGLVRFDQSVVSSNGFFHDIVDSIEFTYFSRLGLLRHGSISVVPDCHLSGLNYQLVYFEARRMTQCSKCCRRVKSRNPSTSSSTPFGKCSLWCQLQIQLSVQIHRLKRLVLTDIGGNHFTHLLSL